MMTLVAAALAGGGSIDDAAVLPTSETARVSASRPRPHLHWVPSCAALWGPRAPASPRVSPLLRPIPPSRPARRLRTTFTPQVATAGRSRPTVMLGCRPDNRARSPQHLRSVAVSPVTVQTCGDLPTIRPIVEGQPSTVFPLQTVSVPSNVNSYYHPRSVDSG